MWRTRVGYAGGTTPDPTYRNIGDHTETFEVDFDPSAISYEDLLQLFWSIHDPSHPAPSRQYESVVFARDDEQLVRAMHSRDRMESLLRRPVITRIELLDRFYLAEDYHQKYRLRSWGSIAREFHAMYPDEADLVNSTAAARVNGYLDGHGSCLALERDADSLGLSGQTLGYLRSRCR